MRRSINQWMIAGLGLALVATPGLARDKSKRGGPAGNPGTWFMDSDYPPTAKRANEQGRVSIRISIDQQGKPTACDVTGSSGSAALDAKTCELVMTRGAFTTQLDQDGKPVPYTYSLSTRWAMRDDVAPTKLQGPWRAAAVLQIDRAGKLASCKDEQSGPVPGDVQLCLGAQQMPPEFGMFARGGSTADLVELIVETSLSFDDAPGAPMMYDSPGRETVKLSVIHFDVATDGGTKNCQVIALSGSGDGDPCAEMESFLPIEKARGVTLKMAMSRRSAG